MRRDDRASSSLAPSRVDNVSGDSPDSAAKSSADRGAGRRWAPGKVTAAATGAGGAGASTASIEHTAPRLDRSAT